MVVLVTEEEEEEVGRRRASLNLSARERRSFCCFVHICGRKKEINQPVKPHSCCKDAEEENRRWRSISR